LIGGGISAAFIACVCWIDARKRTRHFSPHRFRHSPI
jgi:hypothetical protein